MMHFSLFSLTAPVLFLSPTAFALTAPAASCYTDNNMTAPAVPDFGLGESSSDPNNIADGPNGWMQACHSASEMKTTTATIPIGYTASYDTDLISAVGVSCSDVAGDLRNLAGQCPHGGVLQHMTIGHNGNVYIKQVGGPNTPKEPWPLNGPRRAKLRI